MATELTEQADHDERFHRAVAEAARQYHEGACSYRQALATLVERLWDEFGTDLIEGDNDHMDMAYVQACGVLHIDPDRRNEGATF